MVRTHGESEAEIVPEPVSVPVGVLLTEGEPVGVNEALADLLTLGELLGDRVTVGVFVEVRLPLADLDTLMEAVPVSVADGETVALGDAVTLLDAEAERVTVVVLVTVRVAATRETGSRKRRAAGDIGKRRNCEREQQRGAKERRAHDTRVARTCDRHCCRGAPISGPRGRDGGRRRRARHRALGA